ncbi:hypothetical protein [Mycolicibacterium fortuitum]
MGARQRRGSTRTMFEVGSFGRIRRVWGVASGPVKHGARAATSITADRVSISTRRGLPIDVTGASVPDRRGQPAQAHDDQCRAGGGVRVEMQE